MSVRIAIWLPIASWVEIYQSLEIENIHDSGGEFPCYHGMVIRGYVCMQCSVEKKSLAPMPTPCNVVISRDDFGAGTYDFRIVERKLSV